MARQASIAPLTTIPVIIVKVLRTAPFGFAAARPSRTIPISYTCRDRTSVRNAPGKFGVDVRFVVGHACPVFNPLWVISRS